MKSRSRARRGIVAWIVRLPLIASLSACGSNQATGSDAGEPPDTGSSSLDGGAPSDATARDGAAGDAAQYRCVGLPPDASTGGAPEDGGWTAISCAAGAGAPYVTGGGVLVWATDDGVKVLQDNDPASNAPVIPAMGGGSFPSCYLSVNDVWAASSRTVSVAGARRETVAFQIFVTAPAAAGVSGLDVQIAPPAGPAGTLPSSSVTLFREWYLSLGAGGRAALQPSGKYPDPLIPFVDPYGTGKRIVPPFDVAAGQTQGIWVDVAIPAGAAPGKYTSPVQILSAGSVLATLTLDLEVYSGQLPIYASDPGLLKVWAPLYPGHFQSGEGLDGACPGYPACSPWPFCSQVITMAQTYQKVAHAYDFDTQLEATPPKTSLDLSTNHYTIDWSGFDALNGPAMDGTLFGDGTRLATLQSPMGGDDAEFDGADSSGNGYGWQLSDHTLPPAGLIAAVQDYSTQISQHFAAKGWDSTEILGYLWDEPGKYLTSSTDPLYHAIELYGQAVNLADEAVGWKDPVRYFLTTSPECTPGTPGDWLFQYDIGQACTDHEGLSYPSVGGVPKSWVLDWAPNPALYHPEVPVTGSKPDYSVDGVRKYSSAPAPLESWFYQGAEPFSGGLWVQTDAIGVRTYDWIAWKYRVSGVFFWVADFWAKGGNPCTAANTPYVNAGGGDGILFYPGQQLGLIGLTNIAGPVPSMRMALWRRSYQDYLYLWLLAKSCGSAVADALADGVITNALNWKDVESYWYAPGWKVGIGEWSHDPQAYEDARRAAGQAMGW